MLNKSIIQIGEVIHKAMLRYAHRHPNGHIHLLHKLEGGCAIGSWFLVQQVQRRLGLKMDFVHSPHHAWTEHEGIIYDVTACQYDSAFPNVRTVLRSSVEQATSSEKINFNNFRHYRNVENNSVVIVNRTWPWGQRPKNYSFRWNDGKGYLQIKGQ